MPTPFSNTLRSLNADRFRASLIGLGIAVVLLIAWGSWFFLARITIYEVSDLAVIASDGFIDADFPVAKLGHVRRGQSAWLYPGPEGANQRLHVPAVVTDVIEPAPTEMGRVKLFPLIERDLADILPGGQKIRVEIEVESVSPAVLVLRASGLTVDTPSVALSPQSQPGH